MSEAQNFAEYYAMNWGRSVSWATRRLKFLHQLSLLLSEPGMVEAFREWAEDREKMHQRAARDSGIGSGEFTYYQGAAVEIGMLVDNWEADIRTWQRSERAFNDSQQEDTE